MSMFTVSSNSGDMTWLRSSMIKTSSDIKLESVLVLVVVLFVGMDSLCAFTVVSAEDDDEEECLDSMSK